MGLLATAVSNELLTTPLFIKVAWMPSNRVAKAVAPTQSRPKRHAQRHNTWPPCKDANENQLDEHDETIFTSSATVHHGEKKRATQGSNQVAYSLYLFAASASLHRGRGDNTTNEHLRTESKKHWNNIQNSVEGVRQSMQQHTQKNIGNTINKQWKSVQKAKESIRTAMEKHHTRRNTTRNMQTQPNRNGETSTKNDGNPM